MNISKKDNEMILEDQDQTRSPDSSNYNAIEAEPENFKNGQIDVKEQMDRTMNDMEASLLGLQNQGTEDSPNSEIGASFKHTPGGLEEVAAKTDEYLASQGLAPKTTPSTDPVELLDEDFDDDDDISKMNGEDLIH